MRGSAAALTRAMLAARYRKCIVEYSYSFISEFDFASRSCETWRGLVQIVYNIQDLYVTNSEM